MKKVLEVKGMTCGNCVKRVNKIISGFDGVSDVAVDLERMEATFESDPQMTDVEVDELQQAVRGESYTLLSPYPDLKSPIVLTTWGIQLELESADDDRIATFIDSYQQGPQTPEQGASCVNGTGSPVS